MRSQIYEVWGDIENNTGLLISTQDNIAKMREQEAIEKELAPLYSIRASSWAEAMTYYNEHNGWSPYKE